MDTLSLTEQFKDDISAYLKKTGTAVTTFGMAVNGNYRLVDNLSKGQTVTLITAERARRIMHDWPDGFKNSTVAEINKQWKHYDGEL